MQRAFLLPAISLVTNDRSDCPDLVGTRIQQRNGESDGEAPPIFVYRRNTKHFRAVSCLTGLHYPPISLPMADTETFRNDYIERMTKRFSFAIAKNSLRGTIPQEYGPVGSCRDDRITRSLYQSLEVNWFVHRRYLRVVLDHTLSKPPFDVRISPDLHLSIISHAAGSMR